MDGRESAEWSRKLTVNLPFLPRPPSLVIAAAKADSDGVVAAAAGGEECCDVSIPDNKKNAHINTKHQCGFEVWDWKRYQGY